jgi:hypothetical protein
MSHQLEHLAYLSARYPPKGFGSPASYSFGFSGDGVSARRTSDLSGRDRDDPRHLRAAPLPCSESAGSLKGKNGLA